MLGRAARPSPPLRHGGAPPPAGGSVLPAGKCYVLSVVSEIKHLPNYRRVREGKLFYTGGVVRRRVPWERGQAVPQGRSSAPGGSRACLKALREPSV